MGLKRNEMANHLRNVVANELFCRCSGLSGYRGGGSEIDTNYAHGCTGVPKDTSSLVLWAGIDNVGTIVPDKSNYAAIGTLVNCANGWGRRTDSACQATLNTCQVPVADVSYDTCLTCSLISTAMASYTGSTGDTAAITSYLNSYFHFSQTEAAYKGAFYRCRIPAADSMYFDKTRYVDHGNNAQYKVGTGAFTVEAWVRTTLNKTGEVILSDEFYSHPSVYKFVGFTFSLSNNNLFLFLSSGNTPYSGYQVEGLSAYASIPPTFLNTWHHVVAERVANGKSYTDVKMWVDGREMPVSALVGVTDGTATMKSANIDSAGVESMKIGSRQNGWGDNFKGSIREARMYKRLLSNSEVISNYNNGCVCEPWDTTALVLWTPLNDGSGYTCVDESHYHATGTVRDSGSGFWGSSSSYCYFNTPVICETHTQHYAKNVQKYSTSCSYPYAFNGMEKDNEVASITNIGGDDYDFGDRMYDSRLGRWFSMDPHARFFAATSPFAFCLNSPIVFKDNTGDDIYFFDSHNNLQVVILTNDKRDFAYKIPGDWGVSDHPLVYDFSRGKTPDAYFVNFSIDFPATKAGDASAALGLEIVLFTRGPSAYNPLLYSFANATYGKSINLINRMVFSGGSLDLFKPYWWWPGKKAPDADVTPESWTGPFYTDQVGTHLTTYSTSNGALWPFSSIRWNGQGTASTFGLNVQGSVYRQFTGNVAESVKIEGTVKDKIDDYKNQSGEGGTGNPGDGNHENDKVDSPLPKSSVPQQDNPETNAA